MSDESEIANIELIQVLGAIAQGIEHVADAINKAPQGDRPAITEMLSPDECAKYIGCSKGYIDNLRYKSKGPIYQKLGDAHNSPIRYYRADIDAWLRSGRKNSINPLIHEQERSST